MLMLIIITIALLVILRIHVIIHVNKKEPFQKMTKIEHNA
jgi:hypothetical protein